MSNIPVADAHCDFLYYMTQDKATVGQVMGPARDMLA